MDRSDMRIDEALIVRQVRATFPNVQAVYLFGSFAKGEPWPESDVDIALLLQHDTAKRMGSLNFDGTALHSELESTFSRDVDLINIRMVSTVFQKEITTEGRRIDCQDETAADEFEMLALSLYQKLNEERAEVLEEGLKSGRFYAI
jgi:predicted nucleotidyltransferase